MNGGGKHYEKPPPPFFTMMTKRTIRLCYRKIIDARSSHAWDQFVFNSSYEEFRMQAQLYNPGNLYRRFDAILQSNPAASQLHFLVSTAVTGYLKQLDEKIPVVVDNLGKQCLSFKQYRFEIVNSDIHDRQLHQVAIEFFSVPMIWHDTIGDRLLLSEADAVENGEGILTKLVQLVPYLSVYSLKMN